MINLDGWHAQLEPDGPALLTCEEKMVYFFQLSFILNFCCIFAMLLKSIQIM